MADKGDSRIRVGTPASGTVSYLLTDRTIDFWWYWKSTGPRPDQSSVQVESVAYWPTEAIGLRSDRAAIAGVRRGRVLIELWAIGRGTLPPPSIDPDTGAYRYAELVLPVKSRVVILDESLAGRGPIYTMFYNPHPPDGFTDSLFAHFSECKDLYRIDFRESDGTSVATKVASPTAQPNVLVEPRLADPFRVRWNAERQVQGYVYILGGVPGGAVKLSSLVLYDADRDGTLDGALSLDGPAWNAGGWGDIANYVTTY